MTTGANVGIGTTNPTGNLEVAGTVKANTFEGRSGITFIKSPIDLEIILEPVDNPGVASAFEIFRTGGSPIFVVGESGNFFAKGSANATAFNITSDARLKTNISQLTDVLEKLDQIRGVSFEWGEVPGSLGHSTGQKEIGVIAQEVKAFFPELVSIWGDEGYMAVDYGRLTAVLIEAVKELKTKNEALEQRIGTLEKAMIK